MNNFNENVTAMLSDDIVDASRSDITDNIKATIDKSYDMNPFESFNKIEPEIRQNYVVFAYILYKITKKNKTTTLQENNLESFTAVEVDSKSYNSYDYGNISNEIGKLMVFGVYNNKEQAIEKTNEINLKYRTKYVIAAETCCWIPIAEYVGEDNNLLYIDENLSNKLKKQCDIEKYQEFKKIEKEERIAKIREETARQSRSPGTIQYFTQKWCDYIKTHQHLQDIKKKQEQLEKQLHQLKIEIKNEYKNNNDLDNQWINHLGSSLHHSFLNKNNFIQKITTIHNNLKKDIYQ